jgi:hypothetical protein
MGDNVEDRLAALESVWYDVIEAVNAGRTAGLLCPECNHPDGLQIQEQGGRTVVSCPNCSRVVEVALNNS